MKFEYVDYFTIAGLVILCLMVAFAGGGFIFGGILLANFILAMVIAFKVFPGKQEGKLSEEDKQAIFDKYFRFYSKPYLIAVVGACVIMVLLRNFHPILPYIAIIGGSIYVLILFLLYSFVGLKFNYLPGMGIGRDSRGISRYKPPTEGKWARFFAVMFFEMAFLYMVIILAMLFGYL